MPGTTKSRREYQRRISLAIDYINTHLDDEILPEQVAASAQFSKFHFYRLFKAMTGDSVAGFVRRLRLERAASQLAYNTDASITEIAIDASFASTQSFAKAFQRQFRMSPSEYRKHGHLNRKTGHVNRTDGALNWHDHQDNQNLNLTRIKPMNIEIKELAEQHVAYIRRFGPYGVEIRPFWERLMGWASARELIDGAQPIGAYWDNPEITAAEKCRTDACISVPVGTQVNGEIVLQTLPGGQYAVLRAQLLSNDDVNEFHAAWQAIYTDWLPDSNYQPDDKPAYEYYYNYPQTPDEKWDVEICIPVKPL